MASINQHRRKPRSSRIGKNTYGTGRANGAYCCEFLSSLSLYNMNKWGIDLELRYGHDRHVRKHRDGRQLPSYYIPPLEWWQHHAYCIRILAYGNNRSITALRRLDPFPVSGYYTRIECILRCNEYLCLLICNCENKATMSYT